MKARLALGILVVSFAALALIPSRPEPTAFGWVPDAEQVRVVAATLPQPDFAATPAYRDVYAGPDDVLLWDASRKVLGKLIPPRDQGNVGSCVAFATASAIEHLLCVQAANGANEEYRDLAQEIIYGGSRVEIGGGRIRGDGSVGAWAAKFVVEYGVLPRGQFGRFDLRTYDVPRCREYGRTGVPDELEPEVRKHPVKAVSNVKTWDEARAAIRNGYPVIVCSNQGFRAARDADGFCAPGGTWYHCMALVGVRGEGRPGGFLLNSWGERFHSGPTGLGDPSPGGFWADARVLDRMLRQGDSWAFSGVKGFPSRKLDWYAKATDSGGLAHRAGRVFETRREGVRW
ncbi:MAG: hypothetical protein KF873_11365 [Gemmataceae bacterium]|nr:hypothetical protein [Gemmataceae bacterium]